MQKEANLQADEHQKEGEVKTAWNSSLCLILGPAKYLHNRFRQKHSYNEEIYENDEEKLIVAVLKTLKTVQVMLGLDARRRKAEQWSIPKSWAPIQDEAKATIDIRALLEPLHFPKTLYKDPLSFGSLLHDEIS